MRLIRRIARGASVAEADVQKAVRPECDVAPVMIGEGLSDPEDDLFGSFVKLTGLRIEGQAGYDRFVIRVGVREVHVGDVRIRRMKRHPEQPLFPSESHVGVHVRKCSGQIVPGAEIPDHPGLFHHVPRILPAGRLQKDHRSKDFEK